MPLAPYLPRTCRNAALAWSPSWGPGRPRSGPDTYRFDPDLCTEAMVLALNTSDLELPARAESFET